MEYHGESSNLSSDTFFTIKKGDNMNLSRFNIEITNNTKYGKYIIIDNTEPDLSFLKFNDCDIDDIIQQLQKIKENNKIEPIME